MWFVVGLGNPGERYAMTRHNVGFFVTDALTNTFPIIEREIHSQYHLRHISIHHQDVLLIQPQTYMNLSGLAVEEVFARYQGTEDHLIVIYDDLDLEVGRMKIRPRGGHGGHKGVKSLLETLDTNTFIRIRIGIGHPRTESRQTGEEVSVVDYVLQPFYAEEEDAIQEVVTKTVNAVELIVAGQLQQAMNLYNRH